MQGVQATADPHDPKLERAQRRGARWVRGLEYPQELRASLLDGCGVAAFTATHDPHRIDIAPVGDLELPRLLDEP